jgi:hypothetical protein
MTHGTIKLKKKSFESLATQQRYLHPKTVTVSTSNNHHQLLNTLMWNVYLIKNYVGLCSREKVILNIGLITAAMTFFVVFSVHGGLLVHNSVIGSDNFLSNLFQFIFQKPSLPPAMTVP